jgi:DNA-binding MarR family transcriptional regulator
MSNDQTSAGRYAYDGLDPTLHEKARLGVLVSLATHPDGLAFNELKRLCSLTDGNLSRHLTLLAEKGLVTIHKGYEGRRPQTRVTLTAAGRAQLLAYVAELERVVRDAVPDSEPAPGAGLAPG